MSLFKRGRVWHYEFYVDGVRYRGSTRETSKGAAREAEDRERDRARTVGNGNDEPPSLMEVAALWWTATQAHLASAKTTAHRLETVKRCVDFSLPVTAITTRTVADAIARRRGETTHNARRPTPSTVNRDIIDSTLRPILNYARRVLEIKGLPEIDWKALRFSEPRGRVREFTAAEIGMIRAKIAHLPHHRDLFEFLSVFGVRLREAWFPLQCLDVEGGRIFLRQRKGGDWHTIPLDEHWKALLAARSSRAASAELNTVWFYEDREGHLRALTPRAFQSYMAGVLSSLGITDARPAHDLRHHAGTQYVRRTGNLRGAQRLLGHENIVTTARYAHASESDVRAGLFGNPAQNYPQNADKR
ncbi:MAG: tyrosine-type recombinase/integrase [Hyphomonas sp.]